MRVPHVDDRVRLLDGVPETELCRGQVGVVCSEWSGRGESFFEVEFKSPDGDDVLRRLIRAGMIAVDGEEESEHS